MRHLLVLIFVLLLILPSTKTSAASTSVNDTEAILFRAKILVDYTNTLDYFEHTYVPAWERKREQLNKVANPSDAHMAHTVSVTEHVAAVKRWVTEERVYIARVSTIPVSDIVVKDGKNVVLNPK
ncbi:MAG: hypothetical protein ACRC5C_15000, partial [Bacilli bacterium]